MPCLNFRKYLTALLAVLFIFPALHNAFAANTGYQADENPAPESAKEIKSAFGPEVDEKKKSFFPAFREKMKTLPPFWRDTSILMHLRRSEERRVGKECRIGCRS